MTPIPRLTLTFALISIALAGCIRAPLETSLKDTADHPARSAAASATTEKAAAATPALKPAIAAPAANETAAAPPSGEVAAVEEKKTADDEMRAWCGQRFIDHQEGKRPGGARTLEQKQADDRMCEALRRN